MLAIVTGGSRGIGKAISLNLSSRGYAVALVYQCNDSAALDTAEQIKSSGAFAKAFKCDISDYTQVNDTVCKIVADMGKPALLVNNAGISKISLLQDLSADEIDSIIDVDLKGAVYFSKSVIPFMIKACKGNIINVSSMWGDVGASCESVYSAAKAGIIGFTKALAKELAPSGIRVNAVSPGLINTDMNETLTKEALDEIVSSTPLERIGTPEDVAKAVSFLAGDDSSFITGQVVRVNGGLVI